MSVIELKDAYIYQKNFLVLSNVDITINAGEFFYLIGKTGSGKSSLLKILYGDLPIDKGSANVVGIDLVQLKDKDIPKLRRKLGIVFQDFQLLTDRTVYNNLLFVMKATGWKDKYLIEERIDEVLENVGMETKKHKMPHELSGGEQQRIAIARALLNHPEVILADEPTGNLDPETSNDIMRLLRNISERSRCAVLMATHDYNLIQNFPGQTIICDGGTVMHSNSIELFES